MTTAPEERKIVVTRTYAIPLPELLAEAEKGGRAFAEQQWGLWASRRSDPFPWGVVPKKPAQATEREIVEGRYGYSREIGQVVFSWMERETGFSRLSSDLYENDAPRELHHLVTAAFHKGFQGRWDQMRAAQPDPPENP